MLFKKKKNTDKFIAEVAEAVAEKEKEAKSCCPKLRKLAKIAGFVYAGLFVVFYFDLDAKAIYYTVQPLLQKNYDRIERPDNTLKQYADVESWEPEVQPSYKAKTDPALKGISVPKAKRVKVTM